ncbi:MAG: hypothetical protein MZV49_11805 [Rhodopseudomonas palustris]|nr:hypothetical protein [Rhodopseudomonas palustris]
MPTAQAGDLPRVSSAEAHAAAATAGKPIPAADHDEIDTEHIFGMTMGSDIGDKGEFELELETFSGIGKRSGYYLTTATHTHFKYTLTDNLRVAPGFTLGTHNISGVPELAGSQRDRHSRSVGRNPLQAARPPRCAVRLHAQFRADRQPHR